jgi:hypothetical protein
MSATPRGRSVTSALGLRGLVQRPQRRPCQMRCSQRRRIVPRLEGPAIRVLSRTVVTDDPRYELFLATTGASLGFLRRSGDIAVVPR